VLNHQYDNIKGITRLTQIINDETAALKKETELAAVAANIPVPKKKRHSTGGFFTWGKKGSKRMSDNFEADLVAFRTEEKSQLSNSVISNFDSQTIAENLTVRLHYFFSTIPLLEFGVDYGYASKLNVNTPMLSRMREEGARIQDLLISAVLTPTDAASRADVIMKLISVGERLARMRSHHALMIVVFSLQSQAIYRLKQSWAIVHARLPGRWDLLLDLTGMGGNKLSLNFCTRQMREGTASDIREKIYILNPPKGYNKYIFTPLNENSQHLRFHYLRVRKEDPNEMKNIRSSLVRLSVCADVTQLGINATPKNSPMKPHNDIQSTTIDEERSDTEKPEMSETLHITRSNPVVNDDKRNFSVTSDIFSISTRSSCVSPFSESVFYAQRESTTTDTESVKVQLVADASYHASKDSNSQINEKSEDYPSSHSMSLGEYIDWEWKRFAIGVVRFDIASLSAGVPKASKIPTMPYVNGLLTKIIRLNELPHFVRDSRITTLSNAIWVQSPGRHVCS
jgi:hypothetical protein